MAPNRPRVKPQIVTPCSSPTAMAAKTAKTAGKSPQKGTAAETQTSIEEEVEH